MTTSPLARRAGVAAAQGILLWWLYAAIEAERWPATVPGLYVALVTVLVLVPGLYYLLAELEGPPRRKWAVLAVSTLALLVLGWHQGTMVMGALSGPPEGTESSPNAFPYALAVVLLCCHALPFAQAYLVHGDWRVRYRELFRLAWRNALLVALAVLFCIAFWLLLALWAQLFRMLGIKFFGNMFFDARFAIPATAVVVGTGIQLAGSVERLEIALREQILRLLKWLAPLAVLILGVFSIALVVRSPELFASGQRVISATWLLWLVATNVLLLNAAYQDGEGPEPYPRWLSGAIRWLVALLVVVAAIALYAIAVRVGEYGLTTSRVWAILVAVLASTYALGYAWAGLRGERWMAGMGRVNVLVALLTIASLTLLLTPILSPYRLTAASQYDRIISASAAGDPDIGPFLTLRFESGRYGQERLGELARLAGHPRADEIRRMAAATRAEELRHLAQPSLEKAAIPELRLEAFPSGAEIEPELRQAVSAAFDEVLNWQSHCRTRPCAVLRTDLNGDGRDEAIVFGEYVTGGLLMRLDGGSWKPAGWVQSSQWTSPDEIHAYLERGAVSVAEPEWSVLVLGDRPFRYRDLERNAEGAPVR